MTDVGLGGHKYDRHLMSYLHPAELRVDFERIFIWRAKTADTLDRSGDNSAGGLKESVPGLLGPLRLLKGKYALCMSLFRAEAGHFFEGQMRPGRYNEVIIRQFFCFCYDL